MDKETLDYEIRTEGFERILLAMQHITQRIKKGEKCVATIEYDPDALFTKITTVIERPQMESDSENPDPALADKMRWAFEQDDKAGSVTIVPMDGEKIVIHNKQEAEWFCSILIGCFQ